MRIVELIPNLSSGGAREVYAQFVNRFRLRGIETTAVAMSPAPMPGESSFGFANQLGVDHYLGYGGQLLDFRGRHKAQRHLRRILAETPNTVLHSHLWPAAAFGAQCVASVPHFVHIHDTRPWVASNRLRDRLRQRLVRYQTAQCHFLSVSAAAHDYHRHLIKNRPGSIILNAVDIQRFQHVARRSGTGEIVFGTAARFSPEKGQSVLIRAFKQVKDHRPDVRLLLAGDGHLRGACETLVKELHLQDSVEFLGQVSPIESFLEKIDIFVLPTLGCEGMPLTVLEAIAAGRPVIASDVPGLSETVTENVNGFLVPPEEPQALAKAMLGISDRREHFLDVASAQALRDWEDAVTEVLRLFERVSFPAR